MDELMDWEHFSSPIDLNMDWLPSSHLNLVDDVISFVFRTIANVNAVYASQANAKNQLTAKREDEYTTNSWRNNKTSFIQTLAAI